MTKYSDSENDWIADQRIHAEVYLRTEGVDHLGVGECPAFYAHPNLALWTVQSKKSPGQIGWWVISGDVPTDYISSSDGGHPRQALRAFSDQWLKDSAGMLRGESLSGYSIGPRSRWPELGDLLRRRALILQEYADDDAIWNDD
jgi:hypothetical protein